MYVINYAQSANALFHFMKESNYLNLCFDKDFNMENVTDMIGFVITLYGTDFPKLMLTPGFLQTAKQLHAKVTIEVYGLLHEKKENVDIILDEAYCEKTKPELSGQILLDNIVFETKKYKTYDSKDIVKELEEVLNSVFILK